jgi:alkanesulfonate monooxygenase SsuD/methylene tetrahydromethanopterin reductase-like flavin-dependent oxidoreductase (luciferase family)
MGDRTIAGSDDHLVDQLGRYGEQGFDEVIVPDFTLGATSTERLESYQHLAEQIVPQV